MFLSVNVFPLGSEFTGKNIKNHSVPVSIMSQSLTNTRVLLILEKGRMWFVLFLPVNVVPLGSTFGGKDIKKATVPFPIISKSLTNTQVLLMLKKCMGRVFNVSVCKGCPFLVII